MTPFRVDWSPDAIADVVQRVRDYRWPTAERAAGWADGCDATFLRDFCEDWSERTDFAAMTERLNRFPQFTAEIDGVSIHFVHLVGEAEGRRPLLLTHGWPGSIREFWRVAEPLAYPSRHGGRAEDAFDVVIPSLPNFGFSAKPAETVDQIRTATLFDTLMRETLGYTRFRAHGGDWGAMITSLLALNHPASLEGIHLTMQFPRPSAKPQGEAEETWAKEAARLEAELGAYSLLQATRPQSLTWAVGESPVAQAAWLLERYHDWADLRDRPFEEAFTREDLLDTVMIYVMTGAFHASARYYRTAKALGIRQIPQGRRVEVPTAFALFPDPRIAHAPRRLVETAFNVSRWREMARGGHFAALEAPDLLVDDLRDWARGEA